jgi:protein-tyrosine sulfotransferase
MATDKREGVLILGAPRSGTTLLRRLIDAHPAFACPGETNVFTGAGRLLRSEPIIGGARIGVLDGLAYAGFPREDVLARLREFAFSFHRDYAAREGKPRWAAKTAFDAFYLEEIEQLCGSQVSYVCIVRHGLDAACSIQELCEKNGGYLRELHEYVARYPMVLEAFAHAWVDVTSAILAFVERRPQDALLIRYEQLAREPHATMSEVAAFLGEPWSADLLEQGLAKREGLGLGDWKTYGRSDVGTESVGRWKKLPQEAIGRLASICNTTLDRCGYEKVSMAQNRSAEESRRRYEVGLLLQGLKDKSPKSEG